MRALLLVLSVTVLFESGVELARRGDYEKAAVYFRKVFSETGSPSAAYNLGWISYRKGELAEAIYWWRLASLKGDRGAAEYLASLKRRMGLDEPELPSPPYLLCNLLSLIELLLLTTLLLYIAGTRSPSKIVLFLLLLSAVIVSAFLISTYRSIHRPSLVVVKERTEAFTQPSPSAIPFQSLRPGSEYRMLDTKDSWGGLDLGKGVVGWVRKEKLLLIEKIQ